MKAIIRMISLQLVVLVIMPVLYPAFGQMRGVAHYISDRNMANLSFSGKQMDPATQAQLQAQLKKQFQKEYELTFNQSESIWKELEGLETTSAPASTGVASIKVTTGGGVTYKNAATKQLIERRESFGKLYLIKDKLPERKWVMTGNSKKIGDYQCSEAIYESIREKRKISFSNEDKGSKTVMDTTEIKVWFTTEIPVPHGPDRHWGLPGLILEMTDGKVTYLCSKVILNPSKPVEIKVPKKGKVVSSEEYARISEEMAEKIINSYSGGTGNTVIKIGN
ncbi:MAG: GLPGLI family protein [Bacteroidota bacterium]